MAYRRSPAAEYARLRTVGVRSSIALVLAARQPGDDDHAYQRALKHGQVSTREQRAAHARAQAARRATKRAQSS